jgi:FkbM family methyltransferase
MFQIHGYPAIRFLVSRILWASRLSSLLTIRESGYRLRFYPSAVSAAMWCSRGFFKSEEEMLANTLRLGDVFIDAGANIGALSLAASSIVGEKGHVYAIEAHPRTVRYLRGNVKLNQAANVSVIHAALGDHDGTALFSNRRSDDQNSVSSSSSGIEVPLRTLDSIVPDSNIRLLKIDVEGFELFVLRGAVRLLRRTDMVFFESSESQFKKFHYTTSDVLAYLASCGFDTKLQNDYNRIAVKT